MSSQNLHAYKLKKEELANFVNALKAEGEVIGPKSNGVEIA